MNREQPCALEVLEDDPPSVRSRLFRLERLRHVAQVFRSVNAGTRRHVYGGCEKQSRDVDRIKGYWPRNASQFSGLNGHLLGGPLVQRGVRGLIGLCVFGHRSLLVVGGFKVADEL